MCVHSLSYLIRFHPAASASSQSSSPQRAYTRTLSFPSQNSLARSPLLDLVLKASFAHDFILVLWPCNRSSPIIFRASVASVTQRHSMHPNHTVSTHSHPHTVSHASSPSMSRHPQSSSCTPSTVHPRSVLSLFSLLFVFLCVLPLCCSLSSAQLIRSDRSESSTGGGRWTPVSESGTGRTDVWPADASTAGNEPGVPDMTSHLRCPALELDPQLAYNQSVHCFVECKTGAAATAGKVSDYEWSTEEAGGHGTFAETQATTDGTADEWTDRAPLRGESSTAAVRFGSVSNFTSYNDSQVIAFVYTAASAGGIGILHVLAGPWGAEIENSPIVFTLKAPPGSDNSTIPVVPPNNSTTHSSFVSLSNPAFIAVCSVAVVLLFSAVAGGVWAQRVFARKAGEVRERQASERQWAHSVPSLKARLDVPQPSTLRSPLLR